MPVKRWRPKAAVLAWGMTLTAILAAGNAWAQDASEGSRRLRRERPDFAAAAQAESPRDAGPWSPTDFDSADPKLPTLVIAGDSTAATGGPTTRGWGAVLMDYFDPARLNLVNYAVGGRSFRTFTSEGRWDRILEHLKPGDVVIIEFGHNDGGGARAAKGRGDVPGVGEETETIERPDGTSEVVHTYGWYARKYIRDARAKGATPIVSTTTVRNIWRDDADGERRVERGMGQMLRWARQVAEEEDALFLDHANITADVYEELGPDAVARFFPQDHTHTSTDGAVVNAETLIAGLKTLAGAPLAGALNAKGQAIAPHPRGPKWQGYDEPTSGDDGAERRGIDRRGEGQQHDAPFGLDRRGWPLKYPPGVEPGMPHPEYRPELPTLWLIGDSTVKEGRDTGLNGGRWGWGHEVGRYFDLTRINVENQALGGTSSRSFRTGGWWEPVREMIRPGDFVMIQFGHNDGGINSREARIRARGTLSGAGDETVEGVAENGDAETVHTYGWYLRQYVAEVHAAGATPIICAPIPRNAWRDGRMVRGQENSYVGWARETAEHERVPFINLNHIICDAADSMGEDFARGSLFRADDATHPNLLGAQVNAQCVVRGVKALGELSAQSPDDALSLAEYLSPVADSTPAAAAENILIGESTVGTRDASRAD